MVQEAGGEEEEVKQRKKNTGERKRRGEAALFKPKPWKRTNGGLLGGLTNKRWTSVTSFNYGGGERVKRAGENRDEGTSTTKVVGNHRKKKEALKK